MWAENSAGIERHLSSSACLLRSWLDECMTTRSSIDVERLPLSAMKA
jgi:hypothetical protein